MSPLLFEREVSREVGRRTKDSRVAATRSGSLAGWNTIFCWRSRAPRVTREPRALPGKVGLGSARVGWSRARRLEAGLLAGEDALAAAAVVLDEVSALRDEALNHAMELAALVCHQTARLLPLAAVAQDPVPSRCGRTWLAVGARGLTTSRDGVKALGPNHA